MIVKWRMNTPSSRIWYGASPGNLGFHQTVNGDRTDHEVKIRAVCQRYFYYAVGKYLYQFMTPTDPALFPDFPGNRYFPNHPNMGTWRCRKSYDNPANVRDAFYAFNGAQHIRYDPPADNDA